jgi:uncharacterized membrane protein YkvA (DUF1232 family)
MSVVREAGARFRTRAAALKADTYTLYLAYRDPRVPRAAKLVAALVVAYALSPIDLIPDFIPILGYLDDVLLLPAGIALAIRLIPPSVLAEHRTEAARRFADSPPRCWTGGLFVVAMWLLALACIASLAWRALGWEKPTAGR